MKVYQIYFDPSQLHKMEKEYQPIFNRHCTVYFESQVIHDLIINTQSHKKHDYFGVVSYKLRDKLGYMKDNWKNNKNIANTSVQEFTPQKYQDELYKHLSDAMSFQRHSPHDTVSVANGFHPGFKKYWEHIMKEIGYNWIPESYENVFYCNFFTAKSEIYERYVKEMLAPAMKVMDGMPELLKDSGYRSNPLPDALKKSFGIEHWPYHAFLCERMFTYFAHIHKLKCLHY